MAAVHGPRRKKIVRFHRTWYARGPRAGHIDLALQRPSLSVDVLEYTKLCVYKLGVGEHHRAWTHPKTEIGQVRQKAKVEGQIASVIGAVAIWYWVWRQWYGAHSDQRRKRRQRADGSVTTNLGPTPPAVQHIQQVAIAKQDTGIYWVLCAMVW